MTHPVFHSAHARKLATADLALIFGATALAIGTSGYVALFFATLAASTALFFGHALYRTCRR